VSADYSATRISDLYGARFRAVGLVNVGVMMRLAIIPILKATLGHLATAPTISAIEPSKPYIGAADHFLTATVRALNFVYRLVHRLAHMLMYYGLVNSITFAISADYQARRDYYKRWLAPIFRQKLLSHFPNAAEYNVNYSRGQ
jgi:hypothetical protein